MAEKKQIGDQVDQAGMFGPAQIDEWFAKHFYGSVIAAQPELYKFVFEAKEDLIQMMGGRK